MAAKIRKMYLDRRSKSLFLFKILILQSALNTIYRIVGCVDGHAQAFIQTDNELQYLVDGVSIKVHHKGLASEESISFSDGDKENFQKYTNIISFHPPFLDFKIQPVGIPFIKKVVVHNPSTVSSLNMLSISGSTVDFHCSFFLEKIIEPGGNTTFDVVFLSRERGPVENTLFIHTSVGSFEYKVQGEGAPNPYRLKPFLRVRVPLNSSYNPIISMHNPHEETLQVTEMYSSGGDLHLELVSGESEAPVDLWAIKPFETKPVMRASFIARKENNHTAYIRIKTNTTGEPYLVIPVEVEVSSEPGIYSPVEVLDFGVIRSDDQQVKLSLSLINSGIKPIQVTNVIATPVNEALKIEFKAVKILPDTFHSTEVASLTFLPSKVQNSKQCSGKIVIKSKNNQFKLSVPYTVYLLHGSLKYDKSKLQFFVNATNMAYSTVLNVTNTFNSTVVIFNVSLSAKAEPYFKVFNFKKMFLKPGSCAEIVKIQFNADAKDLQLSTFLVLHTNISYFNLPLICYTGRLQTVFSQTNNKKELEFGTLGMGEKRTISFRLHNNNQVQVKILTWSTNMTRTVVKCVSIQKSNSSYLNISSEDSKAVILKPSDVAIFQVEVTAPSTEGKFFGMAIIKTIYEVLKIPFTFTAAEGSLNSVPNIISFDNAFPGKISTQPLYIQSTFSQPMKVSGIKPSPADPRFYYQPIETSGTILKPESKTQVGKVHLDLRKTCQGDCYVGLSTSTARGHKWLSGVSLPSDLAQTDKNMYSAFKDAWNAMKDAYTNSINVTLQLDTEDVQGFLLQVRAKLKWPQLSTKKRLKFPLTQIGNLSVKELVLENPASVPVVVQVLTLPMYPNHQLMLDTLDKATLDLLSDNIETENPDLFILMDLEKYQKSKDTMASSHRAIFESFSSSVSSNKNSIVIVMNPGMKVKLRMGFSPKDERFKSSLIIIRNNLTIIDAVVVEGQGGHGEMRLGNKEPSLKSTLLLEMTEKHLADCERRIGSISTVFPSRFTVKRSFTARNTGNLPIFLSNFYINSSPCQGYGFRILNCHSFHLMPNSSYKVDIAFTPDFTLNRIERVLSIETSLSANNGLLNYSLVATVPSNMLDMCGQAIPRAHWEPFLYYSVVSFMIFLLICVFITAYFESDRILRSTYVAMATTGPTTGGDAKMDRSKVFDLKTLGAKNFGEKSKNAKKSEKCKPDVDKKNNKSDRSYLFFLFDLFRRNNKSSKISKPSENGCIVDGSGNCENSATDMGDKGSVSAPTQSDEQPKDLLKKKCVRESDGGNEVANKEDANGDRFKWSTLFKRSNGKTTQVCMKSDKNDNTGDDSKNNAEYYSSNKIIEIMDKETITKWPTKSKSKRKGNKNNAAATIQENDLKRFVKKCAAYEEETSSTTTETSNPDSDNSSEKPESKQTEKIKSKSKASHYHKNNALLNKYENRTVSVNGIDDDGDNLADFELSTKSKAHKKIKIDSSKVYGGDVLKPSTLELPYKIKSVKINKEGKENKMHKNKDGSSHRSRNKASAENTSASKSTVNPSVNFNGDLKTAKPAKMSEVKHPGPIGQKPSSLSANAWGVSEVASIKSSAMSSPLLTPSSGADTLDSFFLPPMHETQSSRERDSGISSLNSLNFGSDNNCATNDSYPTFDISPWESIRMKPMTTMQKLQAERRQRNEDYRKQQSLSTDWPGFENRVDNHLWEPSYQTPKSEFQMNGWPSTTMTSSAQLARNDGLWHDSTTSGSSNNSTWNPVCESTLWPTSNEPNSNVLELVTPKPGEHKHGRFNPFHNLSSIWSTPNGQADGSAVSSDSPWSNSFFSDNTQTNKEYT